MTIWHLLALSYALLSYQSARKIINEKYQNCGVGRINFFEYPKRFYREGDDAVAIGKITRYSSVIILLITITDAIGIHNLTFHAIIVDILIYNTLLFFLYPVKSTPPLDKQEG